MDWDNLFSGLVGAIVGGILSATGTYFATMRAAERTMTVAVEQEKSQRKEQETSLRGSLLRSLLAEINENLHFADNYEVRYAKVRLLTDSYEQMKRNLQLIPPEIIEPFREAYAAAMRFNKLVDYQETKVNPGAGTWDKDIAKMAGEAKEKFSECKRLLEEDILRV